MRSTARRRTMKTVKPWIAPAIRNLEHLGVALHHATNLLLIHGVMSESEGNKVRTRIVKYMGRRRKNANER